MDDFHPQTPPKNIKIQPKLTRQNSKFFLFCVLFFTMMAMKGKKWKKRRPVIGD